MNETPAVPKIVPPILVVLTGITGIVDAVSVLALGHVFTANMTGNVVFLGFALARAPGFSAPRSALALACFGIGAAVGGRVTNRGRKRAWLVRALFVESSLLLLAAAAAFSLRTSALAVIATTALAMGVRNAMVRKLNVPDLTTTVLTLTVTGLASDSTPGGGTNPRWQRRLSAIAAMLSGAMAGALMVRRLVALPLLVCSVITAAGAWIVSRSVADEEDVW